MENCVAIDYETYLISQEQPVPKPVCLSAYDGQTEHLYIGEDIERYLNYIFNSNKTIIAHNATFELMVTSEHYPALRQKIKEKLQAGQIICTKVYEQLIDNTRKKPLYSFDLASLVNNYFYINIAEDKKNPDAWRLRYHELDGVPLEDWPIEARRYAIDDSIYAYRLYAEQKKTPIDYKLTVSAEYWLNRMGSLGINIDKDRVNELESEIVSKLEPTYNRLIELNLVTKNKKGKYQKNLKALKELIQTNIPNPIKTPKGNISTSGEDIDKLLLRTDLTEECRETFQLFRDISIYEKVLSAFVSRLKGADTIRTQYNACVSSGRTSSRTSQFYASVNIQQMPRQVPNVKWDVRNCFIPRPGYKICSIDYAGLELSSTAFMLWRETGKRDMLDIINSGSKPTDMHSVLAYRLKNMKEKTSITYDDFAANKKAEGYKEYRQLAKPINLGFPGGIGYDTMRSLLAKEGMYPDLHVLETATYEQGLNSKAKKYRAMGYPVRVRRSAWNEYQLIRDELITLKQELFNLYPDLQYFLREGHKEYLTGETKSVKNEYGEWEKEPMYSFEIDGFKRDYCMYTQVCNGLLMQSPAAIGAKKAVVAVMEKYAESDTCHPLAFIHDEIVLEVLDNEDMYGIIEDIGEIMIDQMQSVLQRVRITVEAELMDYWKKAGGFWSKTFFKDAKR